MPQPIPCPEHLGNSEGMNPSDNDDEESQPILQYENESEKPTVRRVGRPKGRKSGMSHSARRVGKLEAISGSGTLTYFRTLTKEQLIERAQSLPPGLELYDICRAPRFLKGSAETILYQKMRLSDTGLTEDLSCPICMGTYQNVAVVKDCLHRFCEECIERWIRTGHQDCPKCRKRIPSRRSLRADPIFQRIVRRLFPDVESFERQNDQAVADVNQRKTGLSNSIFLAASSKDISHTRQLRRGSSGRGRGRRSVGSNRQVEKLECDDEDDGDDEDMELLTAPVPVARNPNVLTISLIPDTQDPRISKLSSVHLTVNQFQRMIAVAAGLDSSFSGRLALGLTESGDSLQLSTRLAEIVDPNQELSSTSLQIYVRLNGTDDGCVMNLHDESTTPDA